MKPTIGDAIVSLNPNTNFSIDDNKIVAWDISEDQSGETQPTETEIKTKLIELEAEWTAQEYARNRAGSYPLLSDQLDMLWHAIDTGDWTAAKVKTTDFYTKLKKVKDDNPKPS